MKDPQSAQEALLGARTITASLQPPPLSLPPSPAPVSTSISPQFPKSSKKYRTAWQWGGEGAQSGTEEQGPWFSTPDPPANPGKTVSPQISNRTRLSHVTFIHILYFGIFQRRTGRDRVGQRLRQEGEGGLAPHFLLSGRRRGSSFTCALLPQTQKGSILLQLLLFSRSVMSDSLQPHGLKPNRLLCPWNFPGKNTGMGSHFPLQGREKYNSQTVEFTLLKYIIQWLVVYLQSCANIITI